MNSRPACPWAPSSSMARQAQVSLLPHDAPSSPPRPSFSLYTPPCGARTLRYGKLMALGCPDAAVPSELKHVMGSGAKGRAGKAAPIGAAWASGGHVALKKDAIVTAKRGRERAVLLVSIASSVACPVSILAHATTPSLHNHDCRRACSSRRGRGFAQVPGARHARQSGARDGTRQRQRGRRP